MARHVEPERALTLGPRGARRLRSGAALCAALVLLAAAFPGIESRPGAEAPVPPPPEERLVRIGTRPQRLVYDKANGWLAAKCAENFPRTASRVFPADYVETDAGLVPARASVRSPLWR